MGEKKNQSGEELEAALRAAVAVEAGPLTGRIAFNGDAYEAASAGGVRRQHASSALESADDVQILEYKDTRMFVATRFMDIGREPFVLLVVGNLHSNQQITGAYRLYGESREDANDAMIAFRRLLERFGLYFRAGDRGVLFVPVLTVHPDAEGNTDLIELMDDDDGIDWAIVGSIRRNHDGSTSVAWPFVINTTAYRRDLGSHRK